MPYIQQGIRTGLEVEINQLTRAIAARDGQVSKAGIVNYTITSILMRVYNPGRYSEWNEVIGILECVKQELYRRGVAVYEDRKIKEKGDLDLFRQR